jgi:integrase
MARNTRNAKIDTRSARARLAVRTEPYWTVVARGCAVGYRRGKKAGTWIARWRAPDGRQHYKAIGPADDTMDPDGASFLSFGQAQAKARASFEGWAQRAAGDPTEPGPYRVADAVRDYLADYQRRGGKSPADTATRAKAFILPQLGETVLTDLTTKRLRDWHAALAAAPARLRTARGQATRYRDAPQDDEAIRRRRATANRTLSVLKAALNLAYHEGRVRSDDAWRRVRPFREADVAKVRYLSLEECRRLVNATEVVFRPMVQSALLTGARYGELARLLVGDFERSAGTLRIRASKAGRPRPIFLTQEGVHLFATLVAGRLADALVFTRPDGAAWGKSHQHRPLREACRRAGISPAASFHVLRHTYASHLVMAGAPLPVIAANLGHRDTRMTERHYAHLAPSHVANVIRAALPKMDIVEQSNVASLRRN